MRGKVRINKRESEIGEEDERKQERRKKYTEGRRSAKGMEITKEKVGELG